MIPSIRSYAFNTERTEYATERLTIRDILPEDHIAVRELRIDQLKSAYARFDAPWDLDPEAVRRRIAMWAEYAHGTQYLHYAVCESDRMIGYNSLCRTNEGYDLGYCFDSHYQRCGYAYESISAILRDVKTRMPCTAITAGTALENIPSVRLLEKLGFTYHHTNENANVSLPGEIRTEHINLMTKQQWMDRLSDRNTESRDR